jgi:hypothetical protein
MDWSVHERIDALLACEVDLVTLVVVLKAMMRTKRIFDLKGELGPWEEVISIQKA